MKKYLCIFLLVGIVYNQNDISIEHLIFKEGQLFFNDNGNYITFSGGVYENYKNGSRMYKGRYKNGFKHGKWIFWNENGNKISEGYFVDGHKDGKWIFFYPNGKKHEEGFFSLHSDTSVWHGKYHSWFNNGNYKSMGRFNYGKKEGVWSEWDSENFKHKGSYLGGIKDSKWEIFDTTAIKILEKTYDDGLLHGEMKSFFSKGKIEMIIHWYKGEKVSLTFWNYNGEEIKNKSVNEIPVMKILNSQTK